VHLSGASCPKWLLIGTLFEVPSRDVRVGGFSGALRRTVVLKCEHFSVRKHSYGKNLIDSRHVVTLLSRPISLFIIS
jgi:hypothetical protein